VLFCLAVTLVPAIEQRLIQQLHPASPPIYHHTGLEFIHGIIAWLCILAVYLVASQLAKTNVRTTPVLPPPTTYVLPLSVCLSVREITHKLWTNFDLILHGWDM